MRDLAFFGAVILLFLEIPSHLHPGAWRFWQANTTGSQGDRAAVGVRGTEKEGPAGNNALARVFFHQLITIFGGALGLLYEYRLHT